MIPERIDAQNVAFFWDKGIRYRPDELDYRCVLCGSPTSIDGGYSSEGHNMVCHLCFAKLARNHGVEGAFGRIRSEVLLRGFE